MLVTSRSTPSNYSWELKIIFVPAFKSQALQYPHALTARKGDLGHSYECMHEKQTPKVCR